MKFPTYFQILFCPVVVFSNADELIPNLYFSSSLNHRFCTFISSLSVVFSNTDKLNFHLRFGSLSSQSFTPRLLFVLVLAENASSINKLLDCQFCVFFYLSSTSLSMSSSFITFKFLFLFWSLSEFNQTALVVESLQTYRPSSCYFHNFRYFIHTKNNIIMINKKFPKSKY